MDDANKLFREFLETIDPKTCSLYEVAKMAALWQANERSYQKMSTALLDYKYLKGM